MRPSFFGQPHRGLALPSTGATRSPAYGSLGACVRSAFACASLTLSLSGNLGAQTLPTEYPGQALPRDSREAAVGQMISSGQPGGPTHSPAPSQPASPAPTLRPAMPPDAWTAQGSASVSANNSAQPVSQPPLRSAVVLASATQEATAPQKTRVRVPLKQAGDEAEVSPTPGNSGSTLQMLMSIGSSLLIVIGLFLGLAWFYRKTLNTSLSGGLPKQVVQVLGRTPIATRQQLVLVRFGSKLVLVSLVQGEARTISEITDPLEVDQLAGLCESSHAGSISNSFRSILHQGGAA